MARIGYSSPGALGDAVVSDVLAPRSFSSMKAGVNKVGTIPTVSNYPKPSTTLALPNGFYNNISLNPLAGRFAGNGYGWTSAGVSQDQLWMTAKSSRSFSVVSDLKLSVLVMAVVGCFDAPAGFGVYDYTAAWYRGSGPTSGALDLAVSSDGATLTVTNKSSTDIYVNLWYGGF